MIDLKLEYNELNKFIYDLGLKKLLSVLIDEKEQIIFITNIQCRDISL